MAKKKLTKNPESSTEEELRFREFAEDVWHRLMETTEDAEEASDPELLLFYMVGARPSYNSADEGRATDKQVRYLINKAGFKSADAAYFEGSLRGVGARAAYPRALRPGVSAGASEAYGAGRHRRRRGGMSDMEGARESRQYVGGVSEEQRSEQERRFAELG